MTHKHVILFMITLLIGGLLIGGYSAGYLQSKILLWIGILMDGTCIGLALYMMLRMWFEALKRRLK